MTEDWLETLRGTYCRAPLMDWMKGSLPPEVLRAEKTLVDDGVSQLNADMQKLHVEYRFNESGWLLFRSA